jgi:hypothetical protein
MDVAARHAKRHFVVLDNLLHTVLYYAKNENVNYIIGFKKNFAFSLRKKAPFCTPNKDIDVKNVRRHSI